jgi:alpha,alpha-trehalase
MLLWWAALMVGAQPSCPVFCDGPVLAAVNRWGLYNDSKDFVDMPLLVDPAAALRDFKAAPPANATALRQWVDARFGPAGSDLENATLPDWSARPAALGAVRNATRRAWALALNAIWPTLARRAAPSVAQHPTRHTLLALPHPTVVPGGRFRESYYWDSLWIVRGLLACGMRASAAGLVENLLHLVRQHGFVPNGGRTYYLGRSQPPMLSEMVAAVYGATRNDTWLLATALPPLRAELAFWTAAGSARAVRLRGPGNHTLSRYAGTSERPRPESYAEDVRTAAAAGAGAPGSAAAAAIFGNITAAAESGWDFSSRWWAPNGAGAAAVVPSPLARMATTRVLPVDLNAILYRAEGNLARFCSVGRAHAAANGNASAAAAYATAADGYAAAQRRRRAAMDAVLWDARRGAWLDGWLTDSGDGGGGAAATGWRRSPQLTAASFVPLWAGAFSGAQFANATAAFEASGLLQPGGVLTTLNTSGQQWDAPNAWPPLQALLIEGLGSGSAALPPRAPGDTGAAARAAALARRMAAAWLESNLQAWQRSGFMYEKYDALVAGRGGGGGEYVPQRGFGWTNGVALALLLAAEEPAPAPAPAHVLSSKETAILAAFGVAVAIGTAWAVSMWWRNSQRRCRRAPGAEGDGDGDGDGNGGRKKQLHGNSYARMQ